MPFFDLWILISTLVSSNSADVGYFISVLLAYLFPKTFTLFGFSNLSSMIVPDEGYSRDASCALN